MRVRSLNFRSKGRGRNANLDRTTLLLKQACVINERVEARNVWSQCEWIRVRVLACENGSKRERQNGVF